MKADKKVQGRMAHLRKYLHTPMEAEIVKEMIADGLEDNQILQALGLPEGMDTSVQPDAHSFDNIPTDEEERAAERGEDLQPGQPQVSGGVGDGGNEEEAGGGDVLSHVAGLLQHLTNKSKSSPKKSSK